MHKERNCIKIAGVIGDPIAHTRSPLIHQYWIKKNNINCFYVPLNVKLEELEKKLKYIKELDFRGLNVTIPHKENILKYCDDILEPVKVIGAANTLYFNNGNIIADNTDAYGFYNLLIKNFPNYNFKKEKVLIFGAGGAARAVSYVYLKNGVSEIRIINRNFKKAIKIKEDLDEKIIVYEWSDYKNALKNVSTVINSTSLGNYGSEKFNIDLGGVKDNSIAIDLIYNPLRTSFLNQAIKYNMRVVNGLDMLIYQAKKGFQNWFGCKPSYTSELKEIIEKSIIK